MKVLLSRPEMRRPDTDRNDDWRARGNCQGRDPETFFPTRSPYATDVAKKICFGCPVSIECLAQGLGTADEDNERYLQDGEEAGVWGGLSEMELRWAREGGTLRPCADCGLPIIVRTGRQTTLCAACRVRRGTMPGPAVLSREELPEVKAPDDMVLPRDIHDRVIEVMTQTPRPTYREAAMLLNVNQATLREYWKQTIRKAERKHGAEAAEQMLGTLHEGQKPTLFLRWLEINGPTMTMEMAADRLDTTTRSIHKMIERALDRKDPRMPAIEHRRRRAA